MNAREAPGPGTSLEIRLLGEVGARRDGRAVNLGGRRQQALLAHLVLAGGRAVSADRLIEELWAGEPPDGAAATIRSYVSRLRGILGPEAAIVGRAAGYALEVPPDTVDATRFEQLAERGRAALHREETRGAAEQLRAALDQWTGPALAGLADDGELRFAAERLEALRLSVQEDRTEAALALGETAGLVDELEGLLVDHPYRERLWRLLMLALYRAGRQADALAAYQRAWKRLRDDLGLEPGEELRALEAAIVRQEVPAAPAPVERENLPHPTTIFVGREAELGAIERHLVEARLVTLTGIGGVGKTRLALEASRRTATAWTDGPWFIDLSALAEPDLVARAVAGALGVVEQSDESVVDRLAARLRPVDALLVLDNCEHLRAACADLAQRLLSAAPLLRILATSREPLGVGGEVDLAVQPLGTPAAHDDPESIGDSDAVRLFLARANDARPGITADPATLEAVATIARDLDGLPLAIELAAARVKALSIAQIADRLGDRFRFLVSWRRLAPDRHRTLKEAMDWSYDLLDERERALLRGLSVFAGGFTLEAAAAVCAGDGDATDRLERLVEASLVIAEERAGAMRYRMLETVRQYAAGRLAESGEAKVLHEAHAAWFVRLAEEAESELTGDRQAEALADLEIEHDNLRVTLAQLDAAGDAERRLRLATSLSRFWYVRGYLAESRRWLERSIGGVADAPPLLRRRALTAASAVALLQGDYPAGVGFAERSLAAATESGDQRLIANGLSNLGAITLAAGDRPRARTLLQQAVALARSIDDTRIAALAINNLGDLALTEGDYGRAQPLFEESLALLRQRGDSANIARSLFNLGSVELMLGATGAAAGRFRESVELGRETGDKEDLAWCLLGLAGVAAWQEDGAAAAALLGAGGALLEAIGAAFKPFERLLHDDTAARAIVLTGAETFAIERARGAAWSLDAAIGEALDLARRTEAATG
ncbi:MAG TPA: BTAD domain-containing putative transcriptional regulator [Candidatus Limnocylindrales bacterium]|nr:BTAD domain-containing putative transcriptional regulator [Candidatus Limnocylindrales bacterium]